MPTIDFILRCIIFIFSLGVAFLFWYGLVALTGYLSKWRKLALAYPNAEDRTLEYKKYVYVRIGHGNYNGVSILEATLFGLRIRTIFLFRPGHKPIYIPWNELACIKKNDETITALFFLTYIFTTSKFSNIKIAFKKKEGKWILEQQEKYKNNKW